MRLQSLDKRHKSRFLVGFLRALFLLASLAPLTLYSETPASGSSVRDGSETHSQKEVASEVSQKMSLIKFSGIWLSGKFSEADRLFPVGKGFAMQLGENGATTLSRDLLKQLRAQAKPDGSRIIDSVAPDDYMPDASKGEALVMACAINYEHVDGVEIGGIHKVIAEVGFDLVICNFADRSIVLSLPGRVTRTDVANSSNITQEKKTELLKNLYQEELIKRFCKLAQSHGPEIFGTKTAAVTKITLFPEAQAILPEWLQSRAEEYIAGVAASNFYEGAGLPLLPFSRGNEVAFCAMREQLSDANRVIAVSEGEARNTGMSFVLKKPDYEIELVIPVFKTVTATSGPAGDVVQNCAYSRITIKIGDSVIYSAQHDGNAQNIVPAGSSRKTPWLAYSDALNTLFFKGGKQILKDHCTGEPVDQAKPMKVIKQSEIRRFFLDCAPWSILSKNQ